MLDLQNLTTSSPIYEGSIAVRGVSGTTPQSLTLNHVEISNSRKYRAGLTWHRCPSYGRGF